MDNILLLDTSVASLNKGDEIIMKCVRYHLKDITDNANVFTLPTHVSPFHWYQVARRSLRVQVYENCKHKFVGGSNLLTMDMLTHFPQWNINIFNYHPLKESILFGVGAGKGTKINGYTRYLYKKVLSHKYIHSVRDARTKRFMEDMGFQALNTGCPTLWSLTPEFCKHIPSQKSKAVLFTFTPQFTKKENDQLLINILKKNYETIYYWIQGPEDLAYLKQFSNLDGIIMVSPTVDAYEEILQTDIDYIGTRLHAGIFAMRQKKRSIIIAVDERARGMAETYNLNTVDSSELHRLEAMINQDIITDVKINQDTIETWLNQFKDKE